MTLYTSFSIYVTYVINLGRRLRHKKRKRRSFCKYVLNTVSLRGGIKPEKERRLAELLLIHIAPYVITDLPLPLSRQSKIKKVVRKGKEEKI